MDRFPGTNRLRRGRNPPRARWPRTWLLLGVAVLAGVRPLAAQDGGLEAPPFIATPDRVVEVMLEMGGVGEGDLVYDLGSGDGRLVIAAALRGARAVGIEYDAALVERSRERARSAGVSDRVTFVHGDIFEAEVGAADVVMVYLSPEFNLQLRPALLSKLAPGARVVSHAFHMGDWAPDEERTLGGGAARATVYRWTVPAEIDGFWWLEIEGAGGMAIELSQTFQAIMGQAWMEERPVRVTGQVDGLTVDFALHTADGERQPPRFTGRLHEGVLSGVVRARDGVEPRRASAVRFSHPSRAPIGRP